MKKILGLMAAFAVTAGAASAQTVVISDDFESYADQAALEAVYTAAAGTGGTVATAPQLVNVAADGALGSDKYVTLLGLSSWTLTRPLGQDLTPAAGNPVNLTFYARAANWGNSRLGVSVRSTNLADTILNLGSWNAATSNGLGTENKYVARVLGWTGGPGYFSFLNGPDRTPNEWVKLSISAFDTSAVAYVNDVELTDQPTMTGAPANPITRLRIGNGVTSPNDISVDSITVSTGLASSVSDWDLMY